MSKDSMALAAYRDAFADATAPFLTAYRIAADKSLLPQTWTRGEFWLAARRIATVLRDHGIGHGDCVTLCLGANHGLDLATRLAAVMTGAVPVTVNWQADTAERVVYKVQSTDSRLALLDEAFPAEQLELLRASVPALALVALADTQAAEPLAESEFCDAVTADSTRIVIFTSGTTGQPKGVRLPYRAYATNRATFEQFLQVDPAARFGVFIVNPMHHTNSTAITDWAMRRPGSQIHLLERYTTAYWRQLCELAESGFDRLVAPAVARHFDFLDGLESAGRLPVPAARLRAAMARVDILIGSAPVGPTTVKRLQHHSGRVPTVRFGSTETCLQVIGIPPHLDEAARLAAFQSGWQHHYDGQDLCGYYIGRSHSGHTEARVVRSTTPGEAGYMADCAPGEPGQLVTRGGNLMSGYVGDDEATRAVFADGWYTGLGDIAFTLTSAADGQPDIYWLSRSSSLLIRGGANYAYDQVNAELRAFVQQHYALESDDVDVAVVGLRVDSEHEDACCVTLELNGGTTPDQKRHIAATFLDAAAKHVTKGSKPDYVRVALIPRNFKGAVLVPDLKAAFTAHLATGDPVAINA